MSLITFLIVIYFTPKNDFIIKPFYSENKACEFIQARNNAKLFRFSVLNLIACNVRGEYSCDYYEYSNRELKCERVTPKPYTPDSYWKITTEGE